MLNINHRLHHSDGLPVPFVRSPNVSGPLKNQEFVIIHYTEGQSAEAAIRVLSKKKGDRSAHLVIGRDGAITQLVPFDTTAWHTGPSSWKDRKGLAPYSIGIELDNAGPMVRKGGRWIAPFGKAYPSDQVHQAPHKHGGRYKAWHSYPYVQVYATIEAISALVLAYGPLEVLGHDDIAPKRKWDPGPAFPMGLVRGAVAAQTIYRRRVE